MDQKTLITILRWIPKVQTSLVLLVLLFGLFLQIRQNMTKRWLVSIMAFLFSQFIIGLGVFAAVSWTYLSRTSSPRYFLPPHGDIFLRKVMDLLTNEIAGWSAALIFFGIGWYFFIRRFKEVFLDRTDLMLMIIGAIAVGWPATLVFLAITFSLSVIGLVTLIILKKKSMSDRLIITPYVLPAAIVTLVFRAPLLELTHLIKIRF